MQLYRDLVNEKMTNELAPEVTTWEGKISKSLNEQLCNKFVCANLLATEHIAPDKFHAVLTSYKQVGANVGETHRNAHGFDMLNSVQADMLLEDDTIFLTKCRFFGLQGDGSHDKARTPQEATNVRVVDEDTGRPHICTLGFTNLRHQDASGCRDAMFSQLLHHGITKEMAQTMMVAVGVDGAAVNMGKFAGIKALIQKDGTESGAKPNLDYWGWSWVILLHCINHLLELCLGDLKSADPYVQEFDEGLKKVFKLYYYSSTMEADRCELAMLTDEDFTSLGGLQASVTSETLSVREYSHLSPV